MTCAVQVEVKHFSVKLVEADYYNLTVVEQLRFQAQVKGVLDEDQEKLDLQQGVKDRYHDLNHERYEAIEALRVRLYATRYKQNGVRSEKQPDKYLPLL